MKKDWGTNRAAAKNEADVISNAGVAIMLFVQSGINLQYFITDVTHLLGTATFMSPCNSEINLAVLRKVSS